MFIDKIILNNFRVYKGEAVLDLRVGKEQNVSVISGNNGFGKTSLLTALIWCLYGKLMIDVDEPYRKEINDSGGYKNYCRKLMNHLTADENKALIEELKGKLIEVNKVEETEFRLKIDALSSFSVAIRFSKIFIPSIPCDFLEVKRVYNTERDKEELFIYIDGKENELTKEVGPEIFISDFILRKEIAKFFFFDAEKIVSLAEVHSLEERKRLSQAYTEVLGIKKYLDLKENLENLRLRLRKKSTGADSDKLALLLNQRESKQRMIDHNDRMIQERHEELIIKQTATDKLQEQLIREGSSITVEDLKEFRQMRDHWSAEGSQLKNEFKGLIEMAPLAIAANLLSKVREQLEAEQEQADIRREGALLKRKLTAINRALSAQKETLKLPDAKKEQLLSIIEDALFPKDVTYKKALLAFSSEQEHEFFAVYENLQNSYSKSIKRIFKDIKVQQASFSALNRRISDAESKAKDPVIQTIRNDKDKLDKEIKALQGGIIELKAANLNLQNDLNNIGSQISELKKRLEVAEIDKIKDETAARLIYELTAFIQKLKIRKKHLLELKILKELKVLMHKSNFVQRVEVIINGDLIDIQLFDQQNRTIEKDTLSKGEQQLYASALLKALIDESQLRFPVFIDSPLQKFDKAHAKNIIVDFYPNISGQVILFPLLEKEFTEEEYQLLLPKVAGCYLIEHRGQYQSVFRTVNPESLFINYRNENNYVYQH